MRFAAAALRERGVPDGQIHVSLERSMRCAIGLCGHCQLGPAFVCRDGPVVPWDVADQLLEVRELMSSPPTLAVWKFASCDGCQLSVLDLEDELLALAGAVDIAYFLEATSATVEGPYDLSLVEGSITTAHDAERIREVRAQSRHLVTIGACATSGGIQALRNFADVRDFIDVVYATPEYVSTLDTSTPISDHVAVDFELHGCPINKRQLLEVLSAFLNERRPAIAAHSVCIECKRAGNVCVTVAHGTPCLGPVTHAGCGALCPAYHRGCYGCYGPAEAPNTDAMRTSLAQLGSDVDDVTRRFRLFYANAKPFRDAAG